MIKKPPVLKPVSEAGGAVVRTALQELEQKSFVVFFLRKSWFKTPPSRRRKGRGQMLKLPFLYRTIQRQGFETSRKISLSYCNWQRPAVTMRNLHKDVVELPDAWHLPALTCMPIDSGTDREGDVSCVDVNALRGCYYSTKGWDGRRKKGAKGICQGRSECGHLYSVALLSSLLQPLEFLGQFEFV